MSAFIETVITILSIQVIAWSAKQFGLDFVNATDGIAVLALYIAFSAQGAAKP